MTETHAEREASAYAAAIRASARGDPGKLGLWRAYAKIHTDNLSRIPPVLLQAQEGSE